MLQTICIISAFENPWVDLYIIQCSLILDIHDSICKTKIHLTTFPLKHQAVACASTDSGELNFFMRSLNLWKKAHFVTFMSEWRSFSRCTTANWCPIISSAALTQSRTFFLNGTSGFFSLSQTIRWGISHPCSYTLRATSIFAAPLMAPGPFVLTWGKQNQEYLCSQWTRPILLK